MTDFLFISNGTLQTYSANAYSNVAVSNILVVDNTVPSTSSSNGVQNHVAITATNLYVCVANNTWRTVALSTF